MDDDYFQDYPEEMMMGDEDGLDLDSLQMEDIMEYIQNSGGEITPELMELLQQQYGTGEEPEAEPYRIAVIELFENCVVPSCTQAFHTLLPLFLLCFVFRCICQINVVGPKDSRITHWFVHMSSLFFGLMVLFSFFKLTLIYPVICCVISYPLLYLMYQSSRQHCGLAVSAFIVSFTILCELFFVESTIWHKVRGAQIILSMKIISLGSDVASGRVASLPNVVEYAGYCFNVGSVIFGPWVSYEDYAKLLNDDQASITFKWVGQVFLKVLTAGLCLLYSNCGTHWIIMDNVWRWIVAYRDAQSFRFSHYFISFLSDATATLSGLTKQDSLWNGSVSRPQNIELPRSLVEVVTSWNLPMHYWLKTYVFKPLRPLGAFVAVIVTYAASSLLHGLNFQLSAVLLSLGFYSYTEFVLRRRLSHIFDACVQAKKCKEKCDHKYQERNPIVMLVNISFTLLAMFHLAYLGLMFDSSDDEDKGYTMWHTLDKWAGLGYLSHVAALGTFVFYWLI